jgi:hypothetical protein
MARMGEKRHACSVLMGIRSGKAPLGRPNHSRWDNVTANLKETGGGDVDWTDNGS